MLLKKDAMELWKYIKSLGINQITVLYTHIHIQAET